MLLASLWWAFELNLLSVDYPKSVFIRFSETFVKSPDATWALLSHTSGLVVFLIIVNIPSKRRWLIFVLLCGVCFLWGLKSLGVPETAWASTTNATGYTLMFFAAITCLGLSLIGGSVVASRHVLGLLVRSVTRHAAVIGLRWRRAPATHSISCLPPTPSTSCRGPVSCECSPSSAAYGFRASSTYILHPA